MQPGDILLSHINSESHLAKTAIFTQSTVPVVHGINLVCLRPKRHLIEPLFALRMMKNVYFIKKARSLAQRAVNQASIKLSDIRRITIPLPPLEVQREIVAEIEGYQRIIDGARAVTDNYRPQIVVDPEWPIVKLGELTKTEYGFTAKAADSGDTRLIRITDIAEDGTLRRQTSKFVILTNEMRDSLLTKGDILVARTGATYGKTLLFEEDTPAVFASYLIRLRFSPNLVHPRYYWAFAQSDVYWKQAKALVTGGGQPQFNGNVLKQISVPLPPVAQQQAIIADIEAEQALVNANRELIERFEEKIQAAVGRVWSREAESKGE